MTHAIITFTLLGALLVAKLYETWRNYRFDHPNTKS